MATIKISDLHPTGADLFQDSENYLNELTDEELDLTQGGRTGSVIFTIGSGRSVIFTIAISHRYSEELVSSETVDHIAVY
jgi:hypothetical protein